MNMLKRITPWQWTGVFGVLTIISFLATGFAPAGSDASRDFAGVFVVAGVVFLICLVWSIIGWAKARRP